VANELPIVAMGPEWAVVDTTRCADLERCCSVELDAGWTAERAERDAGSSDIAVGSLDGGGPTAGAVGSTDDLGAGGGSSVAGGWIAGVDCEDWGDGWCAD